MNKLVAWVAAIAVILSLGTTFFALWTRSAMFEDAMGVTKLLFSWKTVAGGLAMGSAATFGDALRSRIQRG